MCIQTTRNALVIFSRLDICMIYAFHLKLMPMQVWKSSSSMSLFSMSLMSVYGFLCGVPGPNSKIYSFQCCPRGGSVFQLNKMLGINMMLMFLCLQGAHRDDGVH